MSPSSIFSWPQQRQANSLFEKCALKSPTFVPRFLKLVPELNAHSHKTGLRPPLL
jgi:hypothetical protein